MTPQNLALSVLSILAMLLASAAWSDFKHHRIPNSIVFSGVVAGVALNSLLAHGLGFASKYAPGAGGFAFALGGLGLGLACLLPFYLLRAMGAGDVKLMAMVGAFLGPADLLGAVAFTFLAGGAMALVVTSRSHAWSLLGQNVRVMLLGGFINASMGKAPMIDAPAQSVGKLPYGVAIAAGTLAWVLWRMFV
jgi:prepilin peptidase CpaA